MAGYAGAVAAVVVASVARWLLHDVLDGAVEFVTFYPAVAVVAMVAGRGPGLVATTLSAAVGSVALFPSNDLAAGVAVGLFVAAGVLISETGGRLRRSLVASTETNARLREEIDFRRRAEQLSAQDFDAMRRLHNLGTLYTREGRLEPILTEIVDAAIAIADADFGTIQLLDPGAGTLRIAAQRGFPQWWVDYWNTVAPGQGVCGAAVARAERVVVNDVERSPIFAGTPGLDVQRKAGVRAVQSTPLTNRSGQVVGVLSTHYRASQNPGERALTWLDLLAQEAAGIIVRAQIEQALRETRDFLQETERVGMVGGWEFDIDTGKQTWTDGVYRIHELDSEYHPTVEKSASFYASESRPTIEHVVRRAIEFGEPFDVELAFVTARGNHRWVHAIGRADPPRRRVYGFLQDITARKQVEEAFRASETRFRLLVENAPTALAMFDREMRYVCVSEGWRTDYGVGSVALRGRSHYDVFSDIPERWKEAHRRGLAGEVVHAEEDRYDRADGTVQWLRWRVQPWVEADGGIGGIVLFTENISQRKQAEEALRQLNATLEERVSERTAALKDRESRLRAVLDSAFSAIITIDGAGIVQSANKAAEGIFGYPVGELLGRNVNVLMASPYREEHDAYIRRYFETGEARIIGTSRELVARRKDGSLFDVAVTVGRVDHLPLFVGIVLDITRRKQLEREVLEIASLEQGRIGQDLHDSVAQELSAMNILAADLLPAVQSDPAAARRLRLLTEAMRRSQVELRAVMRGLLPVAIDREGLMSALSDLATRTESDGAVVCMFDCPRPVVVEDNVVATHLYLIAQEAVRNAVKHAGCQRVVISLATDGSVVLRVTDDGRGLPADHANATGLGLRILKNRATIIGASLTIETNTPSGTEVRCVLPRRNRGAKTDYTAAAGTARR